MKDWKLCVQLASGLLVGLLGFFAFAQEAAPPDAKEATPPVTKEAAPPALKGQIIASPKELNLPTSAGNFVSLARKQDHSTFNKDAEGRYVINFVAFFSRPAPVESMGIVVLDGKKEPIAVADVTGTKGQQTLSSQIVIETTETPNKKHVLQVYYVKGKKPVVLARKEIILN